MNEHTAVIIVLNISNKVSKSPKDMSDLFGICAAHAEALLQHGSHERNTKGRENQGATTPFLLGWLGSQRMVVSAISPVTRYGSMLDAGLRSSK
jgi:hypothetical protein